MWSKSPSAILASLLVPVCGDLPVHCMLHDVSGEWNVHLGPVVPPAFSDAKVTQPQCGHHIPNNVLSMLALDADKVVPSSSEKVLKLKLTEDIKEQPKRHLHVMGEAGETGAWTMMFDEGFEVRLENGLSMFAHFHFQPVEGATQKPSNGDRWGTIKTYLGRKDTVRIPPKGELYECHCERTSTGWWHRRNDNGEVVESGCLWASKTQAANATSAPAFVVRMPEAKPATGQAFLAPISPTRPKADRILDISELPPDSRQGKAVLSRGRPLPRPNPALLAKEQTMDLPRQWDWRDVLAHLSPDGVDDLSEQFDQGNCGSCYAFSGAQVLQMRFRIQLWKRHELLYPLELSWKSATRCSPYTEGCEGGFAYLTFKFAAEVGLPLAECDTAERPQDLDQSCDWGCYRNTSNLFYAKDYGQTGGFAHGASEAAIMKEIHENGPVIVSFATSAVPEFIYNNGQSLRNDTNVMTVFYNEKVPTEPSSVNPEILPWRYTTHSILAVGWGEEPADAEGIPGEKYWLVRNSWGTKWGVAGYAKIRRGQNDAAIETSAPWVEPDMERLPPGFLERAQEFNRTRTEALKTESHPGRANGTNALGGNKGGTPLYCKLRPDSPDCQ